MKKILFLIHDLSVGGAEKVLVNLVNNMDPQKFDITVLALFGGGVNEQFLKPHIHYKKAFSRTIPGNSKLMKLLTPRQLHRWLIKERYDIEVSYLEGPSARIVSGCPVRETRLVTWIHCTMGSRRELAESFRSLSEARKCYQGFDAVVCVSEGVRAAFQRVCPTSKRKPILYNTNETTQIVTLANEPVEVSFFPCGEIKLVGAGKLMPNKGFDRLARVHKRLRDDGFPIHTYVLGVGPERKKIERYLDENRLRDSYTFLGYQTNPYKYVAKCDLFVCASTAEGFSTAATEALIVGTPVCTVEVSGMREMLGEHNEWGVVTENSEEALYQGIKRLLDEPELLKYYQEKAKERGKSFSTENTVNAVEDMLEGL